MQHTLNAPNGPPLCLPTQPMMDHLCNVTGCDWYSQLCDDIGLLFRLDELLNKETLEANGYGPVIEIKATSILSYAKHQDQYVIWVYWRHLYVNFGMVWRQSTGVLKNHKVVKNEWNNDPLRLANA